MPELLASTARLIGREKQLRELEELSKREPLVTLRGAPGVGKTRLAQELVSRSTAPAWLCELESALDARDVCAAVAAMLGVPLVGADPAAAVGSSLAARGPSLLVLDNFEQLPFDVVKVVERWLAMAPECRIVITSRHPLDSEREATVLVEPLGTGGPSSAALELLMLRARRTRPDFDEPDASLLARLVEALDGLPLAIELAAPRLATLGANALLERLDTRLGWRENGRGERSSSLEATLDASWQLLEPAERSALAQCSVFRGTFNLEAAEAVLDAGAPTLDLLVGLHRKSLLRVLAPPGGRFSLLASVRELAARRLEPSQTHAVRARHAAYYAAGATLHGTRVNTADDARALSWLRRETENLAQVIEDGDPHALEAALGLSALWVEEGPMHRGCALLERALRSAFPASLEARGRLAHANLALRVSRAPSARDDIERAIALAEKTADRATIALGHRVLGELVWWSGGRLSEVRVSFERALEAARGASAFEEGLVLHRLANLLVELGEAETSVTLAERSLAVFSSMHAERRAMRQVGQIATVLLGVGRIDSARETLSRATAIAARSTDRDPFGEAMLDDVRSELTHREGRIDDALTAWSTCAEKLARLGFLRNAALSAGYAGIALRELGRTVEAREQFVSAIERLREVGDERVRAYFEGMLGGLAAEEARFEEADTAIESAMRRCTELGAVQLALAVELQHVILDRARSAHAASPLDARSLSQRASRRLADAEARVARLPQTRGFEIELSLRLVRAATELRSPAGEALLVEREGRFLRGPGGERVDLRRSPVLRALVVALATARRERPGVPLGSDELVRACWPNERMARASASNRLRVALATLRRLGLRELLQRDTDGWRLDPTVACEWIRDAPHE